MLLQFSLNLGDSLYLITGVWDCC